MYQDSTELPAGQHFLSRPNSQTHCQIRVIKAQEFLANNAKEINKAIQETALVNSTFASAILQLTLMNTSAETLNEYITIFNSLQKCLSTSISSLEQISGKLSVAGT